MRKSIGRRSSKRTGRRSSKRTGRRSSKSLRKRSGRSGRRMSKRSGRRSSKSLWKRSGKRMRGGEKDEDNIRKYLKSSSIPRLRDMQNINELKSLPPKDKKQILAQAKTTGKPIYQTLINFLGPLASPKHMTEEDMIMEYLKVQSGNIGNFFISFFKNNKVVDLVNLPEVYKRHITIQAAKYTDIRKILAKFLYPESTAGSKIQRGDRISMRLKQKLLEKKQPFMPVVITEGVNSHEPDYNIPDAVISAEEEKEILNAHAKAQAKARAKTEAGKLGNELQGLEIPHNDRDGRRGWRGVEERRDIYYDCIYAYDQHIDCTADELEDDPHCKPLQEEECQDILMGALTESKMHVNRDRSELNKIKVWNALVENIDYIKDAETEGDGGTTGYNALVEKLKIIPETLWGE